MKKKIIISCVIIVIILAFAGLFYASSTLNKKEEELNKHLISLTFTELQEKINNKESFILVLTKENCSHCYEYKPVLKKVLKDNNIYAYDLSMEKLSKEENAKLKDIANASGTPTTIFITNGEEQSTSTRLVGTQSETKIISRLKAMGYIK